MSVKLELEVLYDDNGAVRGLRQLGQEAERSASQAEKAFSSFENEIRQLTDRLDPARARARQFAQESDKLNSALSSGVISGQQHRSAMAALHNEYAQAAPRVASFSDSLKSMAVQAAAAYATLQTAQVVAREFGDAVTGAAAEERSLNQLSSNLRALGLDAVSGTAKIGQFADAMQRAGFADDQTRAAVLRLLPVTGNLTESIRGAETAFSAYVDRGIPVEKMLEKMADLYGGKERGLIGLQADYGITLDETKPKADQLREAIDKLNTTFGNQARSVEDSQQQIDSLKLVYGELKDTVGADILDILNTLNGAMQRGSKDALSLQESIVKLYRAFNLLGGVTGIMKDIRDWQQKGLDAPTVPKAAEAADKMVREFNKSLSDAALAAFDAGVAQDKLQGSLDASNSDRASAAQKQFMDSIAATNAEIEYQIELERNRAAAAAGTMSAPAFIIPVEFGQSPDIAEPKMKGGGAGLADSAGVAAYVDTTAAAQMTVQQMWADHLGMLESIKTQGWTQEQVTHEQRIAEVNTWESTRIAEEALLRSNGLLTQQQYEDAKTFIERQASDARKKISKDEFDTKAQFYSQEFSRLGQNLMALGAHNKKAFKVGQASAMAGAVVSVARAITKDMELGWPMSLVAIAADVAQGAAQISAIKSAKPPAYAQGTPYVPETGLALLHEGEAVIPRQFNQPDLMGPQSLSVSIDARGAWFDSEERVRELGDRMAREIRRGRMGRLN